MKREEYHYKRIEFLANQIQKDCHETVDFIIQKRPTGDPRQYQDATNVFLFNKLAELEKRIEELESVVQP